LIRIAFCQTNRLFILLERAEKEIRLSMANGMFKMKMDIDRHSPRHMPNHCKNLNPPYFSLQSTFNLIFRWSVDFNPAIHVGGITFLHSGQCLSDNFRSGQSHQITFHYSGQFLSDNFPSFRSTSSESFPSSGHVNVIQVKVY
jgi:hypothetical protein